MLEINRALTALPLIVATCMMSACAADVASSESEAAVQPASEPIDSTSAPLARTGGDRFWYEGNVFYCFDSSVPEPWRTTVRDALTRMKLRLPLTFHADCSMESTSSYVKFYRDSGGSGGRSDEIGRDGGEQTITFFQEPSEALVVHEMLHAVGLYHEHERPDRDTYVNVRKECIDPDRWEDDYEISDEAITSGVYDYQSIMHYRTGTWCASSPPSSCMIPDGQGGTACATMLKEDGSLIPRNRVMSREDVNSIYYMYSRPFPAAVEGDSVGKSVAVGDFDGDGYSDVAVGLPGRTVGGISAAGEVRVYKGTSRGLYPWQTITQSKVGWVSTAGDRFGWTLAAANLDEDEDTMELIIGSPYKAIDGLGDAGAVAVLRSDQFGMLQGWRVYTQRYHNADVVRANAQFGRSVAVGRIAQPLDGSGAPDLSWGPTLVIGAPGTDKMRGAVFLYAQTNPPSGGTSQRWTQKISGTIINSGFGSAVAVGSVTDDSRPDLVVGSPFVDALRGQVDVFGGNTPAVFNASAPMVDHRESVPAPDADTGRFGESLALGNFRGDAAVEIAIGASGTRSFTGAVYIFQYESVFGDPRSYHRKQTLWQNGAQEAGDEFGSALTVANVDQSSPQDELFIGAPGENDHAGAISVFRGQSGTLQPLQFLQQRDVPSDSTRPSSRFGASLASGTINGLGDSGVTSDDFENHPAWRVPDVVVGSPSDESFSLFFGKTVIGLEGVRTF